MNISQSIEIREKVIDIIRAFFKNQGFREVFTPILVPVPSIEPNLEVFETLLRTPSYGRASPGKKKRAFLIMSPEYSIKKLLGRKGSETVLRLPSAFVMKRKLARSITPSLRCSSGTE